ncbi:MAG: FxsA family protein [Qingshengfaniella sp.]
MWLLIAFIAVPLIEIGLFIQVGGLIGLWPTLAIVLGTAILGTTLVRSQGSSVLRDIQGAFNRLDDPTEPIAHGAMVLIAGVLLLTPGFFTDALGFALLVPTIRSAAFHFLRSRIRVQGFTMGTTQTGFTTRSAGDPHRPDIIDGEFHEIDPDSLPPRHSDQGPSGWTRH